VLQISSCESDRLRLGVCCFLKPSSSSSQCTENSVLFLWRECTLRVLFDDPRYNWNYLWDLRSGPSVWQDVTNHICQSLKFAATRNVNLFTNSNCECQPEHQWLPPVFLLFNFQSQCTEQLPFVAIKLITPFWSNPLHSHQGWLIATRHSWFNLKRLYFSISFLISSCLPKMSDFIIFVSEDFDITENTILTAAHSWAF